MMARNTWVFMKSKLLFLALLALAIAPVSPVFADQTSKATLSQEKSSAISNSCSSIRQSLKNLQRADSHARTYFGAIYETVFSKYLKPLNLRLVNNDLSNPDLSNLQTSFAAKRTTFSEDFITYSKSLEELIAIDCRLDPDSFYQKLLETREKRAKVASDVKNLNQLMTDSVKLTEKLKGTLNE